MNKKTVEKDLKEKDLNTEISEVMEKVFKEGAMEKVFTNITKLKCNYTTYKEEREKYGMPIVNKCAKCETNFKNGDELYSAYIENQDTRENYIICEKCAK